VDFAYAKTAPEMLARAITIARMLCTGWDLFMRRNFQQVERVSDWFPYTVSEAKIYGKLAGN